MCAIRKLYIMAYHSQSLIVFYWHLGFRNVC